MRHATLMSLALAALLGAAGPARAAPPERPPAAVSAAAQGGGQGGAARPFEKRRRNSYAACNRESHRRDLHGGPRRRFLIRCRLGYERRQNPSGGPAAGPARRP